MYSNEINESEFFEENDLYIEGKVFKENLNEIEIKFNLLGVLFKNKIDEKIKAQFEEELKVDDIKISNLEDEIEEIIEKTTNDIIENKKKQIFVLEPGSNNKKNHNNYEIYEENNKKQNYLRNEAKILEEKIKSIELPTYQEIKTQKFKNCELNSYHFFKNFCKKEVGKENNYIFNYRDNYLNDMTKIDQLFFKDYFKPIPIPKELSGLLVYEFSIYHPTKNIKTQQISILSTGNLANLKDKIYCVLDEIQTNPQRSFFFIENIFYNFVPNGCKEHPLSYPISENRLKKLSMKDLQNIEQAYSIEEQIEKSKFIYNKSNYSNQMSEKYLKTNNYENLNMEDMKIGNLPMRIGYPYLFRHIESCDHMIILNDIRTIDKFDNFKVENGQVNSENVAVVTYQKKLKRRKCDACLFYYAKFISINDIVMGDVSHALFLCEYCLKKLHSKDLSENNTSNLKLIPYFHD